MAETATDTSATRDGWTPARRQAQEARTHAEARVIIPLVLAGRGQVGKLEIPDNLSSSDWDTLTTMIEVYRDAMAGGD